jgi:uncharacterized protein DUF4082
MGQEALTFPIEPTATDAVDGTQAYNMGIRFTSAASRLCYGVRWRVPDSVSTPPGGTHAISIWSEDTLTRLAYKEFTPVPGGYQDILFDAAITLDAAPALYVAAVYTVHYSFATRTVTPISSPSGNLSGDLGRLASYNGGAALAPFPVDQFGTPWYYISPIADDGVIGGVTPAGMAVPVAQGAPTVALGLSTAPNGQSAPVALGSPAVAIPSTAPSGIAVPVALGQPTVGPPATTPSGLAVPVAVGQPSVSNTLVATPSGLAIPVAIGQPTVGPAGVQPNGQAIPVATGQPAVALGRVAAPAGLAIPVALGQPSVVPVAATDSPNPPIVASTRGRVIVASTSYPRVVTS